MQVTAFVGSHRRDGLVFGQLEDAAGEEAAVEAVADQEDCEGAEREDRSVHLGSFSVLFWPWLARARVAERAHRAELEPDPHPDYQQSAPHH